MKRLSFLFKTESQKKKLKTFEEFIQNKQQKINARVYLLLIFPVTDSYGLNQFTKRNNLYKYFL